ncbi:hypothetical protein RB195_023921 [Necator americanus]|uniref:G-protein coupled receptors family 1 profile domain-containing protein n=1 Tax=Necator americanus TaxID=51031 RepID=A0ABR1EL84_NECAM
MKINNKTGAFMVFQALKGSALFLLVSWTIFANTLVFIVLHKNRRLQTVPNLLVGNLAFSDLCLGLIVLPLSSVYAIAADILCSTASIWNLSIVGLDRYWAITSPVTYMSKRNKQTAYIMILSVWISSSLISLAPLLGWKQTAITSNLIYDKNNTVRHCTFLDLPSYTVYSATGSFFIPTLLMFFVYFKIYQAFGKHRARQLYRQKVIRKHIESTILHEISHVLPAHNVFDKDEEEDSESSDQIENDICIENVHTAKEWGDKPSVAPDFEAPSDTPHRDRLVDGVPGKFVRLIGDIEKQLLQFGLHFAVDDIMRRRVEQCSAHIVLAPYAHVPWLISSTSTV